MGLFKRSLPICPQSQHCARWAQIYFNSCLCNVRDRLSLTLGFVSVITWAVAEIPQIITNYKQKSTEGVSIGFLITWIIGDLFNLIGCKLEPLTLPTQYYMALLYTCTTLLLTTQTIYYGHFYHRVKASKIALFNKDSKDQINTVSGNKKTGGSNDDMQFKGQDDHTNGFSVAVEVPHQTSSPIPVGSSVRRDLYYRSARSLSKSYTPTAGSYPSCSHDIIRASSIPVGTENPMEEPLLDPPASVQSAPLNTKSMLCVVSVMTFFLCGFNLRFSLNDSFSLDIAKPRHAVIIPLARKLLQSNSGSSFTQGTDKSIVGTFLGWLMAAIYMGGRLPQIFLNLRRGNVEGLNPLMFIFALVGNTTYVSSILVKSLDWSKIKPNLPWLVDAGGCIFLDCFILLQFMYFRFLKRKDSQSSHRFGAY